MTDNTQGLDEIKLIVHEKLSEYSLHPQETHVDGCIYEDDDTVCNCSHSWEFNQYPKFIDDLEQSILQWISDEVIGIDWTYAKLPTTSEAEERAFKSKIANSVLRQQRSTLKQHGFKQEGDK
jgi:hypothetical protein